MNSFFVDGNLVKDPTLGYTKSKKPFCQFTIANEEWYKGKKTANFIDCILWGNQAKNFCELVKKGSKVQFEEASVRPRTFTDEKTGQRRVKTEVHCFRWTLMNQSKKPEDGGENEKEDEDGPY